MQPSKAPERIWAWPEPDDGLDDQVDEWGWVYGDWDRSRPESGMGVEYVRADLTRGDALAKAEAEVARLKKALWLMAREYERWHRVGDDRIEKRPYEQQTRAVQAAWDALGGDDA